MKIFLKTGCILCTCFLIIGLFYEWISAQVTITSSSVNASPVISSVETDRPEIGLTFDVGSENTHILQILEILEDHQIHATFFVTENFIQTWPEDVQQLSDSGQEVGYLAENNRLSDESWIQNFQTFRRLLTEQTGKDTAFFRPPYENYSSVRITAAAKEDCIPIGYSRDIPDWKDYPADEIIRGLQNPSQLKKGDILRFHTDADGIAQLLPPLLTVLEALDLTPVPVSQLLAR